MERTPPKLYCSNGYEQHDPFVVYLVGPTYNLCRLFLASLKGELLEHARQNPKADRIESNVPNGITCLARTDKNTESDMRYQLVSDYEVLEADIGMHRLPRIDAFVMLFNASQPTDFTAIKTRHVPTIMQISSQMTTGPPIVFFLVAHSGADAAPQAFSAADMGALVKSSRAVFRRIDANAGADCAALIKMVMTELKDSHMKHFFAMRHRPLAAHDAVTTTWRDAASKLMPVFALCGAGPPRDGEEP